MSEHLESALCDIAVIKANGGVIVMTNGCFDVLHPGHLRCLQEARLLGTHLLVAINSDESVKRLKGDDRPIFGLQHRRNMLLALKCIDWVVPFGVLADDTPAALIDRINPDILVKGGDYSIEQIVGSDLVKSRGGTVVVVDYVDSWSTTAILEKIRCL